VVNQVTFLVNAWLNCTLRVVLNASDPSVALEYSVGAVPVEDQIGKEVVLQYSTVLRTGAAWWADANAREMQPRVRNQRYSYNQSLPIREPIANNYVPMNSAAYITDGTHSLTVLNDRAQGVASQLDGQLEVMVHRRLVDDDGRGVAEPLNETDIGITSYYSDPKAQRLGRGIVVAGTHYLFFGSAAGAAAQWRPKTQRVYAPFTPLFAPLPAGGSAVADYIKSHAVDYSWLKTDLPVNVEVVTLAAWGQWQPSVKSASLLRLAHMFGVDEDAALSKPVSVDLSALFETTPAVITPVSLTATRSAGEAAQRMEWRAVGDNAHANMGEHLVDSQLRAEVVTLNPLEVQTFIMHDV